MALCYCNPHKHPGDDFTPRQQRSADGHSSYEPYLSFNHTTAGSPPSDSVDKADTQLNNDNWDVWQSILNEKIQHFEDMGDKLNASIKLPSKVSPNWQKKVLNPRFIHLKDRTCINKDVLSMLEKSVEEWDSEAKIEKLNIAFDTKKLALGAEYHVKSKADEATWEGNIYRRYFLLEGETPYDEPTETRAIHRFIQPQINYRDHLVAPPPYDEATSERRVSKLPVDIETWSTSHTEIGQKKFEGEGTFFKPDHVYACKLSKEDAKECRHRRIKNSPAFRASADFVTLHSLTPAYFIEESKPDERHTQEAENYLLLIVAIVLHERLLLRSNAREDYERKQFQLDDSHRIFFMTCCGRRVCLYQMQVKDIWTTRHKEKYFGEPIGYEAVLLAEIDLFNESDNNHLKSWLNAIHQWGITVYYDHVLEEAKKVEAVGIESLKQVAFRYTKNRHTITFEDPQADDAEHGSATVCCVKVPEASAGTDNAHWQPRLKSNEEKDGEMKEDGGETEEEPEEKPEEKPEANSAKKATGKKTETKRKASKQQKNPPVEGTRKSSRIAAGTKRSALEEPKEEKAPAKKATNAKKG